MFDNSEISANSTIYEDAIQLEYIVANMKQRTVDPIYSSGNRPELPSYKAMLTEIVGEKINEQEFTIPWLFDETKHSEQLAKAAAFRNSLRAYVDSEDEQHVQIVREVPPIKPPSKAGRPKGSCNKEKSGATTYRHLQIPDRPSEDEQKLLDKYTKYKGFLINMARGQSELEGVPINARGKQGKEKLVLSSRLSARERQEPQFIMSRVGDISEMRDRRSLRVFGISPESNRILQGNPQLEDALLKISGLIEKEDE